MDEHAFLLPACDGMTVAERTERMVEDMADWSFCWDDDRNLVMLTEESEWLL